MFGFFKSKKQKNAKELLSMAYKVYNYRRDIIAENDAYELSKMISELDELVLDGKVATKEYDTLAEKLEKLMRKCGGTIYPLTTIADYVDMIVVAGILALGIRYFFLQPFKIPTNSMYPSFYGMTHQVYTSDSDAPSIPERAMRFVLKGASNYKLTAPCDGDLFIKLNTNTNRETFYYEIVPTKMFYVWPTQERIYTLYVGDKKLPLVVPADFPIDKVIQDAFPQALGENANIANVDNSAVLKLGSFKKGQTMLNFDILGGDMLFVDRFTYNFRKPKVGEPIVFKTKYCEGMTALNGGVPDDKYYIKRLVAKGNDSVKVADNTLYINGEPAKGSPAFELNAKRVGKYCGYKAEGALANGATVKIPEKHYYAMGDNSENSLDSRYWGYVPEKAIVGKSLIIFYPFTERWGATK